MTHSSLGRVVRRLRLRHVDNSTGHATNADNATRCTTTHQVLSSLNTEEICSVDVDAPELLHALIGVGDSFVVLAEAGRGDKAVNFAVLFDYGGEGLGDGFGGGDITEVTGYEGDSGGRVLVGGEMLCRIGRHTSWSQGSRCARCRRPPLRLSWPRRL